MEPHLQECDWHQVDASADPAAYAAYLDRLDTSSEMKLMRGSFVDHLPCKPGDRILDSGCGTGSDTLLLAQRVGPSGRVLGLDFSQSLLRHAQQRRSGAIDYAAGSLLHLPLTHDCFDGAVCNRVLMHLDDPQTAVCELVRALKPGAWLALCEPDWSTARIEPDGPISRALMQDQCAGYVSGDIGPRLPGLMRTAGCPPFHVQANEYEAQDFGQVVTLANLERSLNNLRHSGDFSLREVQQWRQQMQTATDRGTFRYGLEATVSIGRKGDR